MPTPRNQSVFKAFSILRSFHQPDDWLTCCELSRRAKLPEASGYRLIQTLEEIGAVVRGPRGRYRPGMLLVSLSNIVPIGELLREASHKTIKRLADRFNVTVHMGILERGMISYIAKISAPSAFPTHTRVGFQLESYCSGLGKVLLAALPHDELESFILDGELIALTPYTITDRNSLRVELNTVRKQGFALDHRESQVDICCVAVPVCDGEGRTVAALSATDNADNMNEVLELELREALFEAASVIQLKVYPPGPPNHGAKPHITAMAECCD